MGLFEAFGAGLSAVQEQDKQRNAITQQLLTQLVAQNPALAETPEIQAALSEAFPDQQYAGISRAFGAANQARLGEESRLLGQQRSLQEEQMLDEMGMKAALANIDWTSPDSVAEGLQMLSAGVGQKAEDARTLQLQDAQTEHERDMELERLKGQYSGAGGRAIGQAIGALPAGLLAALGAGAKATEVPVPEPGAETAAQADIELVQAQLEPRIMNLAQITHLHESLGERSGGVKQLWLEFGSDPDGFTRDYGQDWVNAKAYVSANEARDQGMLMSTIGSNAESSAIMGSLTDQVRTYLQGKADERRVSIPQQSAFDNVNRAVTAAGGAAPFPPGVESGDVLYPGQGDEVYTQPELTFEMLPPMAQEMYMRGESINGLNAMYSQIIQVHGLDMDAALVDMRDLEQQFIQAGYLEPMYGGQ